MKVQVLMSACKVQKIEELVKGKNIKDAVIVNQMMPKYKEDKYKNMTMYSYNEKGLAKSRNRLLENASGDIGIITDDDITFVKDYDKIIEKAYLDNPSADVIIFNFKRGDKEYGGNKKFIYNKITILKVISFQITFRVNKIRENNIKFDENFGIGATFGSGEENIFLADCLKHKLKIVHVPVCICIHPDEPTTGEKWTEKEIRTKGAVSKRVFKLGVLYKSYLLVTKHKYYKKDFSYAKFNKLYKTGKKQYKELSK